MSRDEDIMRLRDAIFREEGLPELRALLSGGVDVNARDGDGRTALMLCCSEPRPNPPAAQLLISARASLDAQCTGGKTALHLAVAGLHLDCLALLLAAGADTEVENGATLTPLEVVADRAASSPERDDDDSPLFVAARMLVAAGAAVEMPVERRSLSYLRSRLGITPPA